MPGARIYYISGVGSPLATLWNVTATSVPVLDGWGWDDYWGCAQWMEWHQKNVQAFGKAIADQKFIAAWEAQDFTASAHSWCKYDTTFRNYFQDQGIDIDNLLSSVAMPTYNFLKNLLNGIDHTTANALDAVTSLSALIKPVGFVAILAGGYWVYKNFLK